MLAGRVAGEPVSCLPLRRVTRSQVVPGEAIVYRANDRHLFVDRPSAGARWLIRDAVLGPRRRIGRLCCGDPVYVTVPASSMGRGLITLSDFVPFTRP